jgi:hypothetical protein
MFYYLFDVVDDGGKVTVNIVVVFCTRYHVFLLLNSGCSPSAVLFAFDLSDDDPTGSKRRSNVHKKLILICLL